MNLAMIQSCYFGELAPVAGRHGNLQNPSQTSIFASESKFQASQQPPFCSRVFLGFNTGTNPFVGKRQNFQSNCLLSFCGTVKIQYTQKLCFRLDGVFMGFKPRCCAKTVTSSSRRVNNGKTKKKHEGVLPTILRSLETEKDVEKTLELYYAELNPKALTVILKEQRSWEKVLRVFEWVKSQKEYIPNVIHYNVVLRALGRARKWDQLRLCWIDMAKTGVLPINNTYSMLVDVYGKAGLVKESLLWIKHMKLNGISPDEVTMCSVLKVLKDGGEYNRAERFYKDWCAGSIELDDLSLDSMDDTEFKTGTQPISLRHFLLTELFRIGRNNNSYPGHDQADGGTSPRKPRLTTTYNTLIDLYGKAGRLKDAGDVFAEMLSSGIATDTVTFNTMIFICGSHGNLSEAESLFDKMEERRINPDTRTYNIFLSLYASVGNVDAALRCYRKIRGVGLFPDDVTRRAILHLLSERNMVEEVDAIIVELEKLGMHLDEHSLPVVMKMYVNEGFNERANVLFKKCHLTGRLSSRTYAAVMDLYADKGQWVKAESVFLSDRDLFGQKKEVVEYNVMIKAYGKVGLYDKAFSLFQSMKNHGTWPDECTYNSLIQMFSGSRDWVDQARALLAEMQELRLTPSCQSFSAVIANYTRKGRLSDATDILQEMSKAGVKPNEVVYGALIDGFAETGNFNEAIRYFHEMEDLGIPVNQIVLTSMIKAYSKLGSVNGANQLYEKIKHLEGGPDVVASNSMLNVYGELGMVSEAESIFDSLKNKGCADGVTYATMIYVYTNMGMFEEAIAVAREMKASGLLEDCATFNKVMACYAMNGELVACGELLQEMIDRKILPNRGTFKVLFTVLKKGGFPTEAVIQLQSSYREGKPYSGRTVIASVFSVVGLHKLALKSCEILINTEMSLDSFAYNTVIYAYVASGKSDEALNIFMRMQDAGLEPDMVTLIHLVSCYGKAGMIEGINRIYGSLNYGTIEPNESLYNAIMDAYRNVNRYDLCELVNQEMRFAFDAENPSDSETEDLLDESLSDAEGSPEVLTDSDISID